MNLESLKWACSYYEGKTEHIIIQPKFMGSRCQIYLFSSPDQCYAVSRNGWVIKHDLTNIFTKLINRYEQDFNNGLIVRILDGELMPWSILGQGLIDSAFFTYSKLLSNELSYDNSFGLQNALESIGDITQENIPKKDYIAKFGYQAYNARKHINLINFTKSCHHSHEDISRFNHQVNLYGKNGDPYFEGFDILKDVYADREDIRIFESNFDKWQNINDGKCIKISPSNFTAAEDFFNSLVDDDHEGVVIKPEFYSSDFAPYIKVRNPEYLRIVYGPDYLQNEKYKKLCTRKDIRRKMRQSIADFNNAITMLNIPYFEISKNNSDYEDILVKCIGIKPQDDPRL